jgi:hypothetical protein
LGGGWGLYQSTAGHTAPANTAYVALRFWNNLQTNGGYHDYALPSIEKKAYCTSFTATTRAAESLTLDVRGLLRPSAGTILGWWYEDGQASGVHYLFDTDGADRLYLRRNGANYEAVCGTGTLSFAKPAVGWHCVALRWEELGFDVLIDGVKQGTGSLTKPLSDVGRTAYFGCDKLGGSQWNNLWQRVPLVQRRWSDAAIRDLAAYGPMASGGC